MPHDRILFTVLACALLGSTSAAADPVCMRIDVPGAQWTQAGQVSDGGAVGFGSDLGGWTYAHGVWTPLPAPPPSSGFTGADLAAVAINDAGVIAGPAQAADSLTEASFTIAGGVYTFFSYPSADFPRTEVRGLNDAGIMTVIANAFDDDGNQTGIALVYDPSGAPPYAPGFTQLHPVLDGDEPIIATPGQINDAGAVVGTARFAGRGAWGFLHDPIAGTTEVFRVDGGPTRARGINDAGQIVGAINGPDGFRGFLRDGAGDHVFDCPELGATGGGIFPESINDAGMIGGDMFDADGNIHGFLAFPSVGAALADLEAAAANAGPGKSLAAKLRTVADDVAAGDTAGACGALGAFAAETSAQAGKHVTAGAATTLGAEARAIAAALGCAR